MDVDRDCACCYNMGGGCNTVAYHYIGSLTPLFFYVQFFFPPKFLWIAGKYQIKINVPHTKTLFLCFCVILATLLHLSAM